MGRESGDPDVDIEIQDRIAMNLIRDDRGSTSLEFALVVPVWVAFVIGVSQASLLLWADTMLHGIVDRTARCMAVHVNNPAATRCFDLATMRTYAMSVSSSGSAFWAANDFDLNDATRGQCPGGSQVSISYAYTLLFVAPVTLSVRSCYPNWS
jgi:Flp pilus assembly protein TadG